MRFCTGCQCDREEEGGVWRKAYRTRRWICKPCVEKKTESIYKNRSGIACDVERLMRQLYAKAGL